MIIKDWSTLKNTDPPEFLYLNPKGTHGIIIFTRLAFKVAICLDAIDQGKCFKKGGCTGTGSPPPSWAFKEENV